MSAFSSSLYSTRGNHQKRYLLRVSSILTPEFKVEKKERKRHSYLKHIYMTEDERDSFIVFKIWSLSKSPFPMIFLTNILWGRFIPLYPSSPPAMTATVHPPHRLSTPSISQGLCDKPSTAPAHHTRTSTPCVPSWPALGDKGQALPAQPCSHPLLTWVRGQRAAPLPRTDT